ncbi:hypothetical protein E2C01_052427 [Portunus trituberculatus]|uniref:Uncharacterized protein n=1 Tax=Portunus trituberculatus TaxID=210409 RepID=A0A5B7GHI4_PORTR|nr:hypothetical protein [Portunus trituberculatus]
MFPVPPKISVPKTKTADIPYQSSRRVVQGREMVGHTTAMTHYGLRELTRHSRHNTNMVVAALHPLLLPLSMHGCRTAAALHQPGGGTGRVGQGAIES